MSTRTDTFDLAPLKLRAGEGRHLELDVPLEPFQLGGDTYAVAPSPVPVTVDVAKMTGGGYSLRLRLHARLEGPCMRCLEPAAPGFDVDAREIDQVDGGPELDSPYVDADVVDVRAWARDALALELPPQILHAPDCLGLCPECGVNLNTAEPGHAHEKAPDPRWAALRELKLE
jgi:uncharacterized protein